MSEKKRAVLSQEEYSRQSKYIEKCGDLVRVRYGDHWPPLALVHSYGCQQNVNDGEKIMGMLSQMGFGFTDDLNVADLILYNTCAVRENAENCFLLQERTGTFPTRGIPAISKKPMRTFVEVWKEYCAPSENNKTRPAEFRRGAFFICVYGIRNRKIS